MNFKDWLIAEIADLANRDTAAVNFKKNENSYVYSFKINGEEFYLVIVWYYSHELELRIFDISFSGPNGHQLTGTAKNSAPAIYSHVLLGLKKLFEIDQVDYISFSAADIKTKVLYDRFFEQFLKKDFIQYSQYGYIRRSKLKEIMQKWPNKQKQDTYKNIILSARTNRDYQKQSRKARQEYLQLKKKLHSFIKYRGATCFFYGLEGNEILLLQKILNTKFTLAKRYLETDAIQEVSPEETQEFLTAVSKISDPLISKFIHSHEGRKLKQLIENSGLPLNDYAGLLESKINNFVYNRIYVAFLQQLNWKENQAIVLEVGQGSFATVNPNIDKIKTTEFPSDLEIRQFLVELIDLLREFGYDIQGWLQRNAPNLQPYIEKYEVPI